MCTANVVCYATGQCSEPNKTRAASARRTNATQSGYDNDVRDNNYCDYYFHLTCIDRHIYAHSDHECRHCRAADASTAVYVARAGRTAASGASRRHREDADDNDDDDDRKGREIERWTETQTLRPVARTVDVTVHRGRCAVHVTDRVQSCPRPRGRCVRGSPRRRSTR